MRSEAGGPALLLQPRGRLDVDTCAELRHQLGAAFAAGVRSVVVDLREVSAVDPIGVGVLGGAARYLRGKGGALVVTHCSPVVHKTLRINDLLELLEVPPPPPLRGLPVTSDLPAGRPARRPGSRPLSAVPAFTPVTPVTPPADPDVALPG